jgi:hypothetical protein
MYIINLMVFNNSIHVHDDEFEDPEVRRLVREEVTDEEEDAWNRKHGGYLYESRRPYEDAARVHNPERVGRVVAREAAEIYYTNNVFYIDSQNSARAIYQLFTMGRIPFVYPETVSKRSLSDIRPYNYIRKIHFELQLHDYADAGKNQWGDLNHQKRRLNYLHTKLLQNFALIPRKELLHLEISIRSRKHELCREGISTNQRRGKVCSHFVSTNYHYSDISRSRGKYQSLPEWAFLNLLQAVREPIYDLAHAGADVPLHVSCRRASRSGDLIKPFHLGPDAWHEVCTKQSSAVRTGCTRLHLIFLHPIFCTSP